MEYVTLNGTKFYVKNGSLDLSYRLINDFNKIEGLDKIVGLQHLDLSYTAISKIKGLKNLTSLKSLSLYYNNIRKIGGLEGFGNLELLDLGNNKIRDIRGVESLENLRFLRLNSNKIRNIKSLESLENLEELHLNYNRIREIKGLTNLKNLKVLSLNGNNISEIQGLNDLGTLNRLHLERNDISELKGLENLTSLNSLYLRYNEISEIKGLENLTNLDTLYLHHNKICEIKGLGGFIKLRHLTKEYVKKDPYRMIIKDKDVISLEEKDIKKIEALRGLAGLKTLRIGPFVPDNRRGDLCRNFVLKTYNASESLWWFIKHLIVNIYVPILIIFSFILIMLSLGINPLLIVQNIFFWLFIGVNLFFITIYVIYMIKRKKIITPPLTQKEDLNKVEGKERVKIGFVGDIMQTGDYDITFGPEVVEFFSKCDFIVGNLEGIMVDDDTYKILGKKISTQRHTHSIMELLKKLGNPSTHWLLCLSNNHSGDLGIEGFVDMLEVLKGKEFYTFGREDNPNLYWKYNDFELNFVAGTMWSNYHKCRFVSRFWCASKYHDDNAFNILYPHWHYENEPYIRPIMGEKSRNFLRFGKYKRNKEIEKFYHESPNNPFQSGLNEWDFIFGHHSHTPQPIEIIEQKTSGKTIKKAIAYSGGNFTSGKGRKKHRKGIIARITLGKSRIFSNKTVIEEMEWRYTYNFKN